MNKSIIVLIVILSVGVLIAGLTITASIQSPRAESGRSIFIQLDPEVPRAKWHPHSCAVDTGELSRVSGTAESITRPLGARSLLSGQEYIIAEYDFEGGIGGPDTQGWISVDLTAQADTFFHVDDFSGLAGYWPLSGSQSLWCGLGPDTTLCYATLPGYGNSWVQDFESVAFPSSGDVTVTFLISYDCEQDYDSVYVQYLSKSDIWQTLLTFNEMGGGSTGAIISADSLEGSVKIRFRFVSDAVYSDEDGNYDSDGAVIIDNITVADQYGLQGSQVGRQRFERPRCRKRHLLLSLDYTDVQRIEKDDFAQIDRISQRA